MDGQAEDQGEAGGVEGGGDNPAQGRLDACPRREDDAGLEGDDAIRNGLSPPPIKPKLLQDIHICKEKVRDNWSALMTFSM